MFGSSLGRLGGGLIAHHIARKVGGNPDDARKIGESVGEVAGRLLPFKKGGKVKGKKGMPVAIMAHAGEYILPVSVKPTKAQKMAVKKLHKPKKSKK